MKQGIKDYLRCVYANKFTLAGYTAIPLSLSLGIFGNPSESVPTKVIEQSGAIIGTTIGLLMLYATNFGRTTLKTYKQCREHISQFGKINNEYYQVANKVYCFNQGLQLAMKEAGLEKTISEEKNDTRNL